MVNIKCAENMDLEKLEHADDLNVFLLDFLENISKYDDVKYSLSETAFTRKRKLTMENLLFYILSNGYHTGDGEVNNFFETITGDLTSELTLSAVSQRRSLLNPIVFKDMNYDVMNDIFNNAMGLPKYKGYTVCACDGSIIELPESPRVRSEFNVPDDNEFEIHRTRGRISCIVDVETKLVLSSSINDREIKETTHAIKQLRELNQVMDLKKSITTFDRGYVSVELIASMLMLETFFIIRLKKNSFKNERKWIGEDDIIYLNLNRARTNNIEDPEIKKYVIRLKRLPLRVVTVKLDNGEEEYLLTNIFDDSFKTGDFKALYNKRWKIETNFDDLKNMVKIENFSGYKREIIEQDFYNQILRYNFSRILQIDAEKHKTRKENPNTKTKHQCKLSYCINQCVSKLLKILMSEYEEKKRILKSIVKKASKCISTTPKEPPSNSNRIAKDPNRKSHQNIKNIY